MRVLLMFFYDTHLLHAESPSIQTESRFQVAAAFSSISSFWSENKCNEVSCMQVLSSKLAKYMLMKHSLAMKGHVFDQVCLNFLRIMPGKPLHVSKHNMREDKCN